jgi:chemotaxis protein MotB
MSKKKIHHEEHVDETWLIPYADMLTLLLALFIVMFAMSKVDSQKFEKISGDFNVIFSGGSGMQNDGPNIGIPIPVPIEQSESKGESKNKIEENKMNEMKQAIEQKIGSSGYADKVKVEVNEGGLEISIQDVVLFNSGDAEVLKSVNPLLLQISEMLRGLDNEIKIVGHSDNIPIHNAKFRSNWELSSMRAINVMNFMTESGKIEQIRFSVAAYADQRPKYDNSTEESRAKNRRVEIFINRKYPKADTKQPQ